MEMAFTFLAGCLCGAGIAVAYYVPLLAARRNPTPAPTPTPPPAPEPRIIPFPRPALRVYRPGE